MSVGIAEKRREVRRSRGGTVTLSFDDPQPCKILARLIDLSKRGFRAKHAYPALHSGDVVEFCHAKGAGKAKVVWNRIADECVETGFVVQ